MISFKEYLLEQLQDPEFRALYLQELKTPQKGPFWLICEVDSKGKLSHEGLLSCPVELSQITPSHKDIWDSCRGKIKKPWNYYPRGRVEVKKDKAIVYANSHCFEYADLSEQLRIAYNLGDLPLELKADNSAHYTEGVWGNYRTRRN